MTGYYDEFGNWHEGPGPYEQQPTDPAPTPAPLFDVGTNPDNPGSNLPDQNNLPGGGKTPAQIEAEGRARDASLGLIGGYMSNGVWVSGSPRGGIYTPPPPGPGEVTFGPGPQLRSLSSLWPDWNPPQMQAPPAFSYEDFRAPTLLEAEAEPGYAFAATQGRKQVEATKAAQGVYKSGQTLKDIYAWASEYAKQNYGGAFDRKFQTHTSNRNNAADSYMTNYGIGRDVFDRNYNAYSTGHQGQRQKAELDFGRDWDMYESDIRNKQFLVNAGND